MGAWHTSNVVTFVDSLVKNKIQWIHYHTLIMDQESFNNDSKLKLFTAIKNSKRKKIIIAHELLARALILLNIDVHIIVPYRCWFENQFDNILSQVLNECKDIDDPMILTCAGMGSKSLIHKLHEQKPNGIYLDVGSALDYICTKKCSRGNTFSYESLINYFKSIIPSNWEDSKYNYIFEKAKTHLGIHL